MYYLYFIYCSLVRSNLENLSLDMDQQYIQNNFFIRIRLGYLHLSNQYIEL